jgi:ubiquinone biosynthesis protein
MLNTFRQCLRLFHIYWILLCFGLDEFLFMLPWFKPFRALRHLNIFRFRHHRHPRGVRIRLALQALGPIFVKFGQTLSTRRDLLPADIADELAQLQDKVPGFSGSWAKKIIEKSLGQDTVTIFSAFELKPLAAASIAQVHEATLLDGQEVVVKVLRPNIKNLIDRDVNLLYFLAHGINKYIKSARRLRPVEVVAEFDQVIHDELDLQREAANASQLKRNFAHSDLLYVPEIYWDYVRENVMVMEKINGIPISDISALEKTGINLKALAERGVEIFFTQVFRDSFFHADMHPGNIFVDPEFLNEPRYLGVDFGIMGTLSEQDQRYLAENLLAFFNRDYRRVALLHVASGWVPNDTRVDQFESAIRTVCEPIFDKPLKDISFAQMLLKLFQTAQRFNMVVQPQLILLQKTLFNVEGLGRQLYPELDLWVTAKPYLEVWMQQKMGLKALLTQVKKNLPFWLEKLPDMPDIVYRYLSTPNKASDERNLILLEEQIRLVKRQNKLIIFTLFLSTTFIVAIILVLALSGYYNHHPL